MGKRIMALPITLPCHATAHIAEYMDTANPVCGLKPLLLRLGYQPNPLMFLLITGRSIKSNSKNYEKR